MPRPMGRQFAEGAHYVFPSPRGSQPRLLARSGGGVGATVGSLPSAVRGVSPIDSGFPGGGNCSTVAR